MTSRVFLALAFAAALLARPGGASEPRAAAVLPFENLSATGDAARRLGAAVESRLARLGWTTVPGAAIEKALDAHGIRYVDSLGAGARSAIAKDLGVSALAFGTVYAWDAVTDPRVSASVRLVRVDGGVLFSNFVSMRAEDAEKLFELGRPPGLDGLAASAMDRLLGRLPRPGDVAEIAPMPRIPAHLASPRTYRSSDLADGTRYRVVALPFANAGPHEASRAVAELFGARLSQAKLFDAVEAADLRSAVVAARIHDLSDPAELRRLGKELGTSLFLTGTIYDYREAHQAYSDTPRIEMEAKLTDVSTGEMVWTSYVERKGTDYRGFLRLGEIDGIVGLADQCISEMIRAAEKARPVAVASIRAARPKNKEGNTP